MKRKIPESLRQQLSKAGKVRAKQFTTEELSRAGKRSWEVRLAKAREAEAKKQQERQASASISGRARIIQNPSIPTKGLW